MRLRLPQRCAAFAAGSAVVLALAACGGGHPARGATVHVVRVTERDFVIHAPHRLHAGTVRFVVTSTGPVSHELIVVRAPTGTLPMRADGLTVDEDAIEHQIVGSLEPDGPATRSLDVRLTPGRYLLLCNMAGHFMSGMSSSLRVR
jgi:uncharacterized cupredoxin-like copper-binding protein